MFVNNTIPIQGMYIIPQLLLIFGVGARSILLYRSNCCLHVYVERKTIATTMSNYSLPSSNILAGNVKREIACGYRKSALVFCEDITLDYVRNNHHCNIQHCSGLYNMIFLFLNRSRYQESNQPPVNSVLLEGSISRFSRNKEEYDCADFLEDNDDDHHNSIDAGALQSVEDPIEVSAGYTIRKIVVVAEEGQEEDTWNMFSKTSRSYQ